MSRKAIPKYTERRLYAESMGKCMNPNCKKDLFLTQGDIAEKAHIIPYSDTEDNSYDNLIILCPNCHTSFDKNQVLNISEVKQWKEIRKKELEEFFSIKFNSFTELEEKVKTIFIRK